MMSIFSFFSFVVEGNRFSFSYLSAYCSNEIINSLKVFVCTIESSLTQLTDE